MLTHRQKFLLLCCALIVGQFVLRDPVAANLQPTVQFNRDIRPIFSNTCYVCHGPDKNSRKANLRLDIREEALKKTKSGIIPIVPGNPEQSEIITRIYANAESGIMPPVNAHKALTPQQKDTLKRWVAEGASYEGHWAYQPITRPTAPNSSNTQATVRNPIDQFIQAKLANAGLAPAAEADKHTLIRRVSLDLTGIPPTPQEVSAFVNDKSPTAYAKLVDRLLASNRYAEKQTMHWLDAVRYADTAGFHGDNAWPAWPYRDYVLRAFRDNKPFDEFTREQLAGDLLPNATDETRVASAYNRINRVSAEGGLQPKEYLAKYGADRVRTTSIVWLGATLGCAECHDHKFDPFLSKDFYAMKAFFADIKETGLVPDRGRTAFGSKLTLPTPEQRRRYDELTHRLEWLRSELDLQARSWQAKLPNWDKELLADFKADKLAWQFQRPLNAQAQNGTSLTIYNEQTLTVTQYRGGSVLSDTIVGDGLVVASGMNPERDVYTVTFKPGAGEWASLGVEVVQDESLPATRLGRGADRFVLAEINATAQEATGQSSPLNFVFATTDGNGQALENPANAAIDGNPQTGWGVQFGDGRDFFLALRLGQPLKTTAATTITVQLHQTSPLRNATIGRFRLALAPRADAWPDHQAHVIKISQKPLKGLPNEVALALAIPAEQRGSASHKAVFEHFKWALPALQPLNQQIAKLEAERDLLESLIPQSLVTETVSPAETRVLPRGNFLDESGEIVLPDTPATLGKLNVGARRATRLDLANWLVSKENPLTARVFVNRLWRQLFGTGLTKTLEDFGSQGEWPIHPELLDWLASEFMHPTECDKPKAECQAERHDWNVKHLIRTIVLSHTYRQASAVTNEKAATIDGENRLLWRQNRYRVEAETVRDLALSVAGLLTEQFGGPSVKPVQPAGFLGMLNFPKRDYAADRGTALYRRGLYIHWQRTFLHPSLATFDAPSREECTVNRVGSNTPLQSLELLNDPIYVEVARAFAQTILRNGGASTSLQIGAAVERALGRKATATELKLLVELYTKSLAQFTREPDSAQQFLAIGEAPLAKEFPAARLAAMTTVSRAILNLHETITRN